MESYTVELRPLTAFGTPLLGDTLFGQFCWAVRNRLGEIRLAELLQGYTRNQPFAVFSDAFPKGHIPMPALPSTWMAEVPAEARKAMKKRIWLPVDAVEKPLSTWQHHARTAQEMSAERGDEAFCQTRLTPHNSIDRRTGTTGEGFAPYTTGSTWYVPGFSLEIRVLLDATRLDIDECRSCLEDIGAFGFGRDATIGLGKFEVAGVGRESLPAQVDANACLTLAPCAPQGLGFQRDRSFYQLFTRFGRHGDLAVQLVGKPFKNPVLLAKAGAVFAPRPAGRSWVGQGLGGDGALSKSIPATVQQGYSPFIPVHLPAEPGK